MSTQKLSRLALLCALALIAHYIESFIPPLAAGVPVKAGLSNIFTLIALLRFTKRDAFLVTILRCVIGPLLGGAPTGIMYSLTGGLFSWAVMGALMPLWQKEKVSPAGMSVAGSFAFNAAQLSVGVLVIGAPVIAYFPIVSVLSIPTGIFVGFCAMFADKRIPKKNSA
ncbi:MAG: Heptaprenyl diphosphate synthase component I [Firmicutes bacterium ADurb.Bin182]|nr:MAG: Heptaprenyl diphosphate synthase component I [Firmicutes bacterium ADurb.Bin182]